MNTKRTKYSYFIISILIILLALVLIIGSISYYKMITVVRQIDASSQFDNLIKIENLQTLIILAGNNAKTYSLTKNKRNLTDYYSIIRLADTKMDQLYNVNESLTDENRIRFDLLDSLVGEKFVILDEYLIVQDKYRVDLALDQVLENLEKSNIQAEISKAKDSSGRSRLGFIKRLMRNKSSSYNGLSNERKENETQRTSLYKTIETVKNQERQIEDSKINQDFKMLTANTKVTQKIDSLIVQFETSEKLRLAARVEKSANDVRFVNQQMVLFFISTGLLVVLLIVIRFKHSKSVNEYEVVLQKAARNAQEMSETKERLLRNVSHEIRTPMNAISGFVDQLYKGEMTSKQEEYISIIKNSSDYLLHVVDEILTYNKLENKKIKIDIITFNIRGFTENLIQILKPQAVVKGIELNYTVASNVPPILVGDPNKLNQILINVVGNAIKFTEFGTVTLQVNALEVNADEITVTFKITDTGIGMTEEQLSIIFMEFEQAEMSTSRKFGGTGLGLSISKKLVDILMGVVNVESSIDNGTTFEIKLPFKKGNKDDVYVVKDHDLENVDLRDLSILVVDDEPYNRKLLCSILKRYGVSITEVENGQEAVAEVTKTRYDLVLMDTRMPVMDGVEAAKVIRSSKPEYAYNVPIISISAATSDEDQERYKKASIDGFIAKPFKESFLISEIKRVVNVPSTDAPAFNYTNDSEVKEGLIDFKHLAELSLGDHSFFIDMLETFVRTVTEGLKGMKKGMAKNDLDMVADYAHKMSSPCKHLSATKLYELLKELERGILEKEINILQITKDIAFIELEVSDIVELANKKLAKKRKFK